MRSILHRGLICTVAIVAALLLGSTYAQAAPPPASVSPLDCFAEWDNNPNYVGDGWVAARILDVNGVFLGCGDELSGMIHIAHPDSTGSIHPVFAESQNAFLQCFQLITQGSQRPDDEFPDARTRYEYTFFVNSPAGQIPQTATLIRDNVGGFVWTMFTPTTTAVPEGNDWFGCSNTIAR